LSGTVYVDSLQMVIHMSGRDGYFVKVFLMSTGV